MINENLARRYCSEDISLIENYKEAVADEYQIWDTHHRRETDEGISRRELVDKGLCWKRPASELIFLKHNEHTILHHLGTHYSEETKKKLSEAKLGEKHPFFGKHHSPESKKNIAKAMFGNTHALGNHLSEETKRKMSEAHLGNKNSLGHHHSEETKQKIAQAKLGKHWYNNGIKNVCAKSCPEGFVKGRLSLTK